MAEFTQAYFARSYNEDLYKHFKLATKGWRQHHLSHAFNVMCKNKLVGFRGRTKNHLAMMWAGNYPEETPWQQFTLKQLQQVLMHEYTYEQPAMKMRAKQKRRKSDIRRNNIPCT